MEPYRASKVASLFSRSRSTVLNAEVRHAITGTVGKHVLFSLLLLLNFNIFITIYSIMASWVFPYFVNKVCCTTELCITQLCHNLSFLQLQKSVSIIWILDIYTINCLYMFRVLSMSYNTDGLKQSSKVFTDSFLQLS